MLNNLINLDEKDLDKAIYRIYPYRYFIKMLEDRNNVLVKTRLWEDPFENFILNATGQFPGGKLFSISSRDQYFGQCWSLNIESDAMWRIYSQHIVDNNTNQLIKNNIGIKVKSTIRKVFQPLYDLQENQKLPKNQLPYNLNTFFGKVIYKKKRDLIKVFEQEFDSIIYDHLGKNQASTLMLKRKAFSYEKEVRIIYYNDKIPHQEITFPYQINPNNTFDELVIDPRIDASLYNEIKSDIKNAGFKNKIFQSGLYKIENFFFRANLP